MLYKYIITNYNAYEIKYAKKKYSSRVWVIDTLKKTIIFLKTFFRLQNTIIKREHYDNYCIVTADHRNTEKDEWLPF